jgi:quercetin dioxygenase-like cupin family protein
LAPPEEERTREYPGDRFSHDIIQQNLDQLTDQLRSEEFGKGHLEQGHNQIELYRHGGTTVSLFLMAEDAELPEHSVDDGSVMIQVLDGRLTFRSENSEGTLTSEENDVIVVESGITHGVKAEEKSRMVLTIMRE